MAAPCMCARPPDTSLIIKSSTRSWATRPTLVASTACSSSAISSTDLSAALHYTKVVPYAPQYPPKSLIQLRVVVPSDKLGLGQFLGWYQPGQSAGFIGAIA